MGEMCRVSKVCWGGEVVVEMTVVGRREKREVDDDGIKGNLLITYEIL